MMFPCTPGPLAAAGVLLLLVFPSARTAAGVRRAARARRLGARCAAARRRPPPAAAPRDARAAGGVSLPEPLLSEPVVKEREGCMTRRTARWRKTWCACAAAHRPTGTRGSALLPRAAGAAARGPHHARAGAWRGVCPRSFPIRIPYDNVCWRWRRPGTPRRDFFLA